VTSSLDRTGRAIRLTIWFLIFLSLVPISVTASRKLRTFGKVDLLLTEEESGIRVRAVGPSAKGTGLLAEDVLLAIDGAEARRVRDPGRLFADRNVDVTLLREGRLLRVASKPSPRPWDLRYLFLLLVGGIFLVSAGVSLLQAGRGAQPEARLLFAAFGWLAALVLVLTPVPPVDSWYRLSVVAEDLARAAFPALLLQLVFTFPRRSRRVPTLLFALPALALAAATLHVYFGTPGAGTDARAGVAGLDKLE